MNAQERIAELTQKMLRRKLYAIFGKTVVPPEQLMPLLPAHLEYLISLEKRGLLFASGPLTEVGAGPLGGGGLTVLRVANATEAREIAEADWKARLTSPNPNVVRRAGPFTTRDRLELRFLVSLPSDTHARRNHHDDTCDRSGCGAVRAGSQALRGNARIRNRLLGRARELEICQS